MIKVGKDLYEEISNFYFFQDFKLITLMNFQQINARMLSNTAHESTITPCHKSKFDLSVIEISVTILVATQTLDANLKSVLLHYVRILNHLQF